jgi:nicotinamide riboside kinase
MEGNYQGDRLIGAMKRIVLTGAECTGKSTLAQALSGYYGEPWTAEFVRSYVDQLDRELIQADLEEIFCGQITAEDAGGAKSQRFVIHDTNLLSSIIYANYYFETTCDWANETLLERKYTLYLLCSPEGIQWEEDPGQRDGPSAREELHSAFKESLEKLMLPYLELNGDESLRLRQAIRAIDGALKQ